MDRGGWPATIHRVAREWDTTEMTEHAHSTVFPSFPCAPHSLSSDILTLDGSRHFFIQINLYIKKFFHEGI